MEDYLANNEWMKIFFVWRWSVSEGVGPLWDPGCSSLSDALTKIFNNSPKKYNSFAKFIIILKYSQYPN